MSSRIAEHHQHIIVAGLITHHVEERDGRIEWPRNDSGPYISFHRRESAGEEGILPSFTVHRLREHCWIALDAHHIEPGSCHKPTMPAGPAAEFKDPTNARVMLPKPTDHVLALGMVVLVGV